MAVSHVGKSALVIGGTKGIGKLLVSNLVDRGESVTLSGRSLESANEAIREIGGDLAPIAVDLSQPETIEAALRDVPAIDHLVITAIERDANSLKEYSVERALRLVTLKLVGYTEVIHQMLPRIKANGSIVLFGGLAMQRPYPGSTTVSTVNGGVTGLVHSLATELAPMRINALHPGIIGDSPYWQNADNSRIIDRTPLGRLVTMQEVVDATLFLLDNGGMNGVNLAIDGGWLLK